MCMLSHFSHVQHFVAPCTETHQVPLPVGFSRREYWSRLPCPPAGALPDPGFETMSLTSPAFAGGFFTISATWEARMWEYQGYNPGKKLGILELCILFL